jgi:hypothetical protein
MSYIVFDVISYTATGSQTFNANGNVTGNALVVYSPGLSGETRNLANSIARELQKKVMMLI